MCAMIEKLRMLFMDGSAGRSRIRDYDISAGGCLCAGSALCAPDHDQVELGAAEEEASALAVDPIRLVVAQEAVGQHVERLAQAFFRGLGVRTRDHDRDALVDEGK